MTVIIRHVFIHRKDVVCNRAKNDETYARRTVHYVQEAMVDSFITVACGVIVSGKKRTRAVRSVDIIFNTMGVQKRRRGQFLWLEGVGEQSDGFPAVP